MRRYDVDALRVIAFGLLIFVHIGNFFDSKDWLIKNSITYEWIDYPQWFFSQWRLSLLFVISGMGTFFNISKKTGGEFAKERFKRLFIPLVTGMIFIVPPMVYIQRLDAGQFTGNYFDFWPLKAFIGAYPQGNFSWHHLWFLPYLLLFSLVLIPVFLYLRNHQQAWIIRKIKSLTSYKLGLLVLVIPLIFWELILNPRFPATHSLVNDWYLLVNYCTLFFYGFLLVTLKNIFWENLIKNRKLYLIIGIVVFVFQMYMWLGVKPFPHFGNIWLITMAVYEWTMILALVGYAATYLNKPSRIISYANEAVYPFYILHLTIIVVLGYYLKNVEMCLLTKFSIMVIGTFGISWLIYEFGIRRYTCIRPLFGMKSKRNKAKINETQ